MFLKRNHLRLGQLSRFESCIKLQPSIRYHSTALIQPGQSTSPQTSQDSRPLRFAICGGGPAGFYSASRLLNLHQSKQFCKHSILVDLFEALPTPFGLSRYGVAPDHPEVKNCEIKFAEVAEHPRFRFFGNTKLVDEEEAEKLKGSVDVCKERRAYVTLQKLRQEYDVVLLAYGASLDRSLGGLPGENHLENILPARTAVNWYNGYPTSHEDADQTAGFVDLSQVERVTIIGQGNVALDIARILLTDIDVLAKTDISSRALQALAQSRVKHVEIVGRRGPLQVAFTTKELRELIKLKGVDLKIDQTILLDAINRLNEPRAIEQMSNGRMSKRLLELMQKGSQQIDPTPVKEKSCSIKFLQTPLAFKSSSGSHIDQKKIDNNHKKVKAIEWQLNTLDYPRTQTLTTPDYSSIRAIPIQPQAQITTPTDLVFLSLGYRPVTMKPCEFDRTKSCVRNRDGRVIDKDDNVIPGLYVTGWLSRGPNGVIANTMNEAFQTVNVIIEDFLQAQQSSLCTNPQRSNTTHDDFLPTIMNPQFRVDWKHWKIIDQSERTRGHSSSKPREKILSVPEMLKIIGIV